MTSKRRLRRRQCGHKTRYANETAAQSAAHGLHNKDGANMAAYRCSWCGKWHVGHRSSGRRDKWTIIA